VGKIHPALLNHCTVFQHTAAATPSLLAVPTVFTESGAAIFLGQFLANAVLKFQQVVLHRLQ